MLRSRIFDNEVLEKPFNMGQLKRLMAYLKPYRKQVVVTVILMFISAFLGLLGPYILKIAIDDYMVQADYRGLAVLALIYSAGNAVIMIFNRQRIITMSQVGQKALYRIRQDLFNHIQKLSFQFYDSRPAGKILVRIINDVNSLGDLLSNGIVNVLVDGVTIILVIVMMLSMNVALTLITLTVMPLMLIVIMGLKKVIRRRWQTVRKKASNMNGYLHESLAGMRVTQAFAREPETNKVYNELSHDIRSSWMSAIKVNNLMGPSSTIIATISTVLVYWFGISFIDSGVVTVGILVAFASYVNRFWQPVNNILNFINSILVAMASTERIFELLDTPADIIDYPDAIEMPEIEGEVRFENLSFHYEPEKPVLKNINIQVTPGETIALVGPTGAGKSTMVNLLSRFYEPIEGRILIDGMDINTVTMNSLRDQMGVMMQDSFIFSGTILDNIRYGKLDASDEEVKAAARVVYADEFIRNMEKGYYTEVKERGSRLSQGQRQLISFARALLADPRILILDEATSSIDTQTEILVQKGLNELLKGRTSFVIAHRLSTIRNADRIMYIEDGRIAECGSHDELLQLKGEYYKLYLSQYRFLDDVS